MVDLDTHGRFRFEQPNNLQRSSWRSPFNPFRHNGGWRWGLGSWFVDDVRLRLMDLLHLLFIYGNIYALRHFYKWGHICMTSCPQRPIATSPFCVIYHYRRSRIPQQTPERVTTQLHTSNRRDNSSQDTSKKSNKDMKVNIEEGVNTQFHPSTTETRQTTPTP